MFFKQKIFFEKRTKNGWHAFGSAMAIVYEDGVMITRMDGITKGICFVCDSVRSVVTGVEIVQDGRSMMLAYKKYEAKKKVVAKKVFKD